MSNGGVYGQSAQGMEQAGQTFGGVAQGNPIYESMNAYINPYQQQVIDNTTQQMQQDTDLALMNVGASADAASAFGGSRHGLVESEVIKNSNQNIGNMTAAMNRQGFMDQASLGAQDVGFNLAGANGLLNASGQGFQMGQTIGQGQAQQGELQRMLMQTILGQGAGQYEGFINQPQDALNTVLAAMGGSPLQNNITQTTTPGLLDYLSLIGQTVGKLGAGALAP